jgi:DNA invertase Pin-like site-specific DNA recombinase
VRVVGYVRTSSKTKDDQEASRPEQEWAIRGWCRRHGHQLVGYRHDEGLSGTNGLADRPGLGEALAMLRAGRADGLVVRELDRLSRDLMVQEAVFADVWKLRSATAVLSTKPGEEQNCSRDDPLDPSRKFIRRQLGLAAEFQRDLIVARLAGGKRAKAAHGGYTCGAPRYGVQVDCQAHELFPDPAEQATLDRIRQLHREGVPIRGIAARLNADGVPAKRGGRWHPTTVARVLGRAGA